MCTFIWICMNNHLFLVLRLCAHWPGWMVGPALSSQHILTFSWDLWVLMDSQSSDAGWHAEERILWVAALMAQRQGSSGQTVLGHWHSDQKITLLKSQDFNIASNTNYSACNRQHAGGWCLEAFGIYLPSQQGVKLLWNAVKLYF